jgi:hypothetical protein
MYCAECSKLLVLTSKKKCTRCNSCVYKNISVICEQCSDKTKQCSACLKTLISLKSKKSICKQCGK